MKKVSVQLFAWILAAGLLAQSLVAQDANSRAKARGPARPGADDKTATRLTLGSSSGTPGTSVVVPIYLEPAEGVNIGHLKMEVTFVSINMKFDKIDRGIAAEMGDVTLTSHVTTGKNDKNLETTTLVVEAETESPKKPVPAGLLGYISMKISDTGRPANIGLHAEVEGTEAGSNSPLKNVKTFDAEVEVLAPGTQPAVACFFFSH